MDALRKQRRGDTGKDVSETNDNDDDENKEVKNKSNDDDESKEELSEE